MLLQLLFFIDMSLIKYKILFVNSKIEKIFESGKKLREKT